MIALAVAVDLDNFAICQLLLDFRLGSSEDVESQLRVRSSVAMSARVDACFL